MKKLMIFALMGATAILGLLYGYQLQNQDVVTNAPISSDALQFTDLKPLPIPAKLVSPEVTSVNTTVEHIDLDGTMHPVYFEFDQNDNLHYVGTSKQLAHVLSYVPADILFEVFDNANNGKIVKAGEHAVCINNCNTTLTDANGRRKKGRGACKTACWVDAAIRILPIVLGFIASQQ